MRLPAPGAPGCGVVNAHTFHRYLRTFLPIFLECRHIFAPTIIPVATSDRLRSERSFFGFHEGPRPSSLVKCLAEEVHLPTLCNYTSFHQHQKMSEDAETDQITPSFQNPSQNSRRDSVRSFMTMMRSRIERSRRDSCATPWCREAE